MDTTLTEPIPPRRSRYTFSLLGTDTDVLEGLTPWSLFAYMQEAATRHAVESGLDAYVQAKQGVWLLRRARVEMLRRLQYGEALSIETWPQGTHLATFLRAFLLYDETGQIVGRGASDWIVTARDTHRPYRPASVVPPDVADRFVDPVAALSACEPPMASEVKATPDHRVTVGYSDLDHHHHVNNTRYLRYALDAIASMSLSSQALDPASLAFRDIDIVFRRELALGDEVDLTVVHDVDGAYTVTGTRAGELCFVARFGL